MAKGKTGLKYDYYLCDFDGTIADTGEGIRRSVAWALERLGRPALPEATLNRFIGPPLHDTYVELFGMTDAIAEHAIEVYRERYLKIGLFESELYPGIAALLKALREGGAYVAVASAKPQFMLERASAHFGIDGFLHAIAGVGLDRHAADKQDLILRALPEGADRSRAVMAGDRLYDIEAAKALGLTAVGADYGYSLPGELEGAGADVVFDDPLAMARWLLE